MFPYGPHPSHLQPPKQPFIQQLLNRLPNATAQAPTPPQPPFGMNPFGFGAVPQQTATTATSGGGLVNSFMKVHKGLQVAQQVLPLWKQYGPLIKQAPLLIDMVKIMLESDPEEEVDDEIKVSNREEDKIEIKKSDPVKHKEKEKPVESANKDSFGGLPAPKLYI